MPALFIYVLLSSMPCNCIISKLLPSPIDIKQFATALKIISFSVSIKIDSSIKLLFASIGYSGVGSSNLNEVFVALLKPVPNITPSDSIESLSYLIPVAVSVSKTTMSSP